MSDPHPAVGGIRVPDALPFLESVSWFDAQPRALAPMEMLTRYEKNIRFVGVTADLVGEELGFVRALARAFGSVLDGRV